MKKILYFVLFFPIMVIGQTTSENYVRSKTYKTATTTPIASPTVSQVNQSITYFDGLGRPIQQIAHQQSSSGNSIVTPIEYDAFGRQVKEYLPYATNSASLNYVPTALTDVGSFSQYAGQTPYSEKLLEASPLNRVLKQSAPGNDWAMANNHVIRFDYQTNIANEVKLFNVNADGTNYSTLGYYNPILVDNGFYTLNQLYKTVTKDENWVASDGNNNTTEEFKDKEGKVVLKRTYNVVSGATEKHDTYYIYDQFGNLTFVLPPLVNTTATITTPVLEGLCYQYKYDNRNRLVEKKLPGKQWEFIIYDKLDRVVATGPALSPFTNLSGNGWMISKYDAFNRVVYTGWMQATVTSATRKTLQDQRNSATTNFNETKTTSDSPPVSGIAFRYTNQAIPVSNYHILTVNYYDDYNFPNAPTSFAAIEGQPVYYNATVKPKGLPTGSFVRVLEATTDIKAEKSYTLYDSKARPIRNYTLNHLGGFTQVDTKLDWAGKVLKTVTTHKRIITDALTTITETFEYTPQDRLYLHKHQINGEPEETLSENFYDELGQLITKNTGTNLQEVNYTYNIRGWLTAINDTETAHSENGFVQLGAGDLFAFKISYNDLLLTYPSSENVKRLYNGNIAEAQWITATDNITRHYGYQYDNLNRLQNSFFKKPDIGDEEHAFNENLQYDKNGNITHLDRNGKIYADVMPIDNLTYNYISNSNQLKGVQDTTNSPQGFKDGTNTGDDYGYDANGNMKSDNNKNIEQITYNHLNLPIKIKFVGGNQITYLYNAVGQKLNKLVRTGMEYADTDYLTGFQYRSSYTEATGNLGTKELQFFPTSEGYVQHKEGRYFYVYNYTDHLGNIRLSYTLDQDVNMIKIMEENHYYPFGLKHDSYNTQHLGYTTFTNEDDIQQYVLSEVPKFVGDGSYSTKYNGKSWEDELGLNMYDYGARNYEPALGRFMNIDRLAEAFESLAPYQYAGNAPTFYIDKNGEYIDINDPNGGRYRYANGVTQKQQEDGTYKDIDVNEVLSNFVMNTVASLYHLENLSTTGKELIDAFSGDKKSVEFSYRNINEGNGNEAKRGAGSVKGFDLIYLDHRNMSETWTTNGFEASPLFITVGHEMSHLTDPTFIHSPWYNNPSPGNPNGLPSDGEIRATHVENKIRAESGYPLRTHYGDYVSGGKVLPDARSTVIDQSGNSVYYNTSKGRAQGSMTTNINNGIRAHNGVILRDRYNYYDRK